MSAQDADKAAAKAKFIAEIPQHTLRDVAGKLQLSIAEKLRSDEYVETWHTELVRLKGKSGTNSDFAARISQRIQEAHRLESVLRRKRHEKVILKSRLAKPLKNSSPANTAQIAAMLLQGYIVRGEHSIESPGIMRAVEDAMALVRETEARFYPPTEEAP